MTFKIGPWAYRVKVTDEPLIDQETGKEVGGLCEWLTHIIWIARPDFLPLRRRKATLLHELRHAWRTELGITTDDESDANDAASFATDMIGQLERFGGEAALMRLNADGVVDHAAGDGELVMEPRTAQCPMCTGLLNMPIRNSAPEFDASLAKQVVWRAADCDFCSHTVSWRESANSKGVPSGTVIGEPVIRGAAGACQ